MHTAQLDGIVLDPLLQPNNPETVYDNEIIVDPIFDELIEPTQMDEPIEEPMDEPLDQAMITPVIELTIEPVMEPVVEPMIEPVIVNDDIEESTNEIQEAIKCNNCDFTSQRPTAFKRHENSIISCDSCDKKFCGKRATRHLESHKKEHLYKPKTPYFCTVCNKAFPIKSILKRHVSTTKCGKTATNMQQMNFCTRICCVSIAEIVLNSICG